MGKDICSNYCSDLFQPLKVNGLSLKNRVAMAPIDTNLADENGLVTEKLLSFYERRARGGAGLIVVENTQVDYPRGKNTLRQLTADRDEARAGLSRLAATIKGQGAVACLQLHHAGRETTLEVTGGVTPVAPSPLPCAHLGTPVRALTVGEIGDLVERFIRAAVIGAEAGFDMIEIHGAHGYLVGQFLSPLTNQRTDDYGDDFDGRFRFAGEIIAGVKQALGSDFPLSFRFSADEFVDGGLDQAAGVEIGRALARAGVDLINVSAGIYESLPTLLEPMAFEEAWRVDLAGSVKAAVDRPVACVGVIRQPETANRLISDGAADLVMIGRGLLADPDWPKKAEQGRADLIRRCIGCNEGCLSRRLVKSIQCSVNPEVGREGQALAGPIAGSPDLVVVGGGPAGLEAARAASERGFRVTLFEARQDIGGQLDIAQRPPGKDKIGWLIDYYRRQMQLLGVEVKTGVMAGVSDVTALNPTAAIVATGSEPDKTPLEGLDIPFYSPDEILQLTDRPPFKSAAIIGAGGIGCETALFLAEKGVGCRLIEMGEDIAADLEPITTWDLTDRLKKAGVAWTTRFKAVGLRQGNLIAEDGLQLGSFEAIVWTVGRSPRIGLFEELAKVYPSEKLRLIGDAAGVGKIHDAIHQAWETVQGL